MDPDNIVEILAELGAAVPCQLIADNSPLSTDSGSQESKMKCTPVTHRRNMAKKALDIFSL